MSLAYTPSTAATALEPVTRCSKLVEIAIKADAELLIARPTGLSCSEAYLVNLLCAQGVSSHLLLSGTTQSARFRGQSEMSFLSSHTCTIGACFLQTRPARAVQVGNTMSGALEDDWVDVGQIDAATTAITGL